MDQLNPYLCLRFIVDLFDQLRQSRYQSVVKDSHQRSALFVDHAGCTANEKPHTTPCDAHHPFGEKRRDTPVLTRKPCDHGRMNDAIGKGEVFQ